MGLLFYAGGYGIRPYDTAGQQNAENRRPDFGGEQELKPIGRSTPDRSIMPRRAEFVNRCRHADAKFRKATNYFYFLIFLRGGCKSRKDVVKYILL